MTAPAAGECDLLASVPYVVVIDGVVTHASLQVATELDVDLRSLLRPLDQIGTRLDDTTFDELYRGEAMLRVRLDAELGDRPVRLRQMGIVGSQVWIEVRSLADQFRMESLLRRSGLGHMLLSPRIELLWSMTSNEIAEVFPGDDPMSWIELMDPDDMQELGRAIIAVGRDPNLRRTVRHRLDADRTYTIIDTVESAVHDPDLRAVLVRSRLQDGPSATPGSATEGAAPYAGMTVSDHMPIGVVVASLTGKVLSRNAVAAELVGARVGQLIVPDGDEPWMLARLDDEQAAKYQAVFASASAGRAAHCTISSPFDPRRWLRLSVSPAAASTLVMTVEDTTELAQAERALRASNRLLEALDSHSQDLVVVFDALGRSRYTSSSLRHHLGATSSIGHADEIVDFVHQPDRALVDDLVRRVRSNPSASGSIEFRVDVSDDVTARWHHATMTNLLDDPDVKGMVLTLRDVHERYLVERDLRFQATHDALTTLPDRAALQSQLEALLREAEEHGHRTALVFCDVDNFKLINDRAGHRVGDLVLTEVADRLRSALRASDFVGRFGGDEFVVVAPNVDDEEHAVMLAERVFAAVTGPVRCDDIDVEVGVSMGVAVSDTECTTSAGLLHRADVAMYESKRRGRGRVSLYSPPIDPNAGEQARLRDEIRTAIADRQLTLHYQPLVPLREGLLRGFESLARWEHPEHGIVDAHRFLAVAEGSGHLGELSEELVRLACEDQRAWFADEHGFVSINLAPSQLSAPDAASVLVDRLRSHGVDLERVVIELTEAAFAQGPIVQANLDVFRSARVRVFLDDFGIGYSSLSHLHHFPVDGIKIDASIIHPVVDQSLVRLIVGVASTLDIRTVAEGVETAEQLDTVARLGVDYAQGHLLGHPARTPAIRSIT